MALGQVPSISNSSLASFPKVSNASIYSCLDGTSKNQADNSNSKEKQSGLPLALNISDTSNPGTSML